MTLSHVKYHCSIHYHSIAPRPKHCTLAGATIPISTRIYIRSGIPQQPVVKAIRPGLSTITRRRVQQISEVKPQPLVEGTMFHRTTR